MITDMASYLRFFDSVRRRTERDVAALPSAAAGWRPPAIGGEPTADYAEQVFLRLEEFALSRRIDVMRKQLERLNPLKDQTDYDALFEQLVALEGARRRVRVAAETAGSSV